MKRAARHSSRKMYSFENVCQSGATIRQEQSWTSGLFLFATIAANDFSKAPLGLKSELWGCYSMTRGFIQKVSCHLWSNWPFMQRIPGLIWVNIPFFFPCTSSFEPKLSTLHWRLTWPWNFTAKLWSPRKRSVLLLSESTLVGKDLRDLREPWFMISQLYPFHKAYLNCGASPLPRFGLWWKWWYWYSRVYPWGTTPFSHCSRRVLLGLNFGEYGGFGDVSQIVAWF